MRLFPVDAILTDGITGCLLDWRPIRIVIAFEPPVLSPSDIFWPANPFLPGVVSCYDDAARPGMVQYVPETGVPLDNVVVQEQLPGGLLFSDLRRDGLCAGPYGDR